MHHHQQSKLRSKRFLVVTHRIEDPHPIYTSQWVYLIGLSLYRSKTDWCSSLTSSLGVMGRASPPSKIESRPNPINHLRARSVLFAKTTTCLIHLEWCSSKESYQQHIPWLLTKPWVYKSRGQQIKSTLIPPCTVVHQPVSLTLSFCRRRMMWQLRQISAERTAWEHFHDKWKFVIWLTWETCSRLRSMRPRSQHSCCKKRKNSLCLLVSCKIRGISLRKWEHSWWTG